MLSDVHYCWIVEPPTCCVCCASSFGAYKTGGNSLRMLIDTWSTEHHHVSDRLLACVCQRPSAMRRYCKFLVLVRQYMYTTPPRHCPRDTGNRQNLCSTSAQYYNDLSTTTRLQKWTGASIRHDLPKSARRYIRIQSMGHAQHIGKPAYLESARHQCFWYRHYSDTEDRQDAEDDGFDRRVLLAVERGWGRWTFQGKQLHAYFMYESICTEESHLNTERYIQSQKLYSTLRYALVVCIALERSSRAGHKLTEVSYTEGIRSQPATWVQGQNRDLSKQTTARNFYSCDLILWSPRKRWQAQATQIMFTRSLGFTLASSLKYLLAPRTALVLSSAVLLIPPQTFPATGPCDIR